MHPGRKGMLEGRERDRQTDRERENGKGPEWSENLQLEVQRVPVRQMQNHIMLVGAVQRLDHRPLMRAMQYDAVAGQML